MEALISIINNKDVKILEINSKKILNNEKKKYKIYFSTRRRTIMFKMLQLYQKIK